MKMFKYFTYEELLPYLGKQLEYETVSGVKRGVLTKDETKEVLWLPFCGGVKATTVKINLVESK